MDSSATKTQWSRLPVIQNKPAQIVLLDGNGNVTPNKLMTFYLLDVVVYYCLAKRGGKTSDG